MLAMSLAQDKDDHHIASQDVSEFKLSKHCEDSEPEEELEEEETNGYLERNEDQPEKPDSPPKKPVSSKRPRPKVECPKCRKMFLKSQLKRHIKANHKYKRIFSCNLYNCNRGFSSKKKLEHHVTYDHEETISVPEDKICPYCQADLKSVVDYKYHVQRDHHHHCEQCHLRFAAKHKLEEHVLAVHQQDIRVDKTCTQCGAVQRGLTDYYRHISKEHTWCCQVPECEFRFASKQKLEEHALLAHSLDIKVDKTCHMCRQEIRSLSDFRTHILRDHRFACPFPDCALRFACKPKLEEHTIAEHETDIKVDRTCPHCQNTIRGLTDYFRHVEKDHRFLCPLCPLKFAYKQKYEEHMLAQHGENVKVDKTCPLCQTSMRSLTDYRRHVGLEHRFECVCPLKFACKSKLEAHSIEVHGVDLKVEKVCPQCGTTLRSLSDYTRHIGTEHRWPCALCDYRFAYKQKLEEHSRAEHGVTVQHSPLYSCHSCGLTFDHRPVWETHLELAHHVPCPLCHMSFTFHSKLVAHCQAVHSLRLPSKEEQLTCPLCRLFFPTTARIAQHSAMEHRYKCTEDQCDFSFVSRYKLEEHASQQHNKHLETNRNNVCLICGQGFTRPENLKKHRIRPHSFHCTHCVKSFIAVDRLERHVLTEHREFRDGQGKGERVLCELCGKNFRQLHILRRHKEIEHKYPCQLCDKKFTMKHWLREHMKLLHPLADIPLPCKKSTVSRVKLLPDLIKIHEEEEEEEEEEVPNPWHSVEEGEYDDEENYFSETSSIYSLLSQELLEPHVQIDELEHEQDMDLDLDLEEELELGLNQGEKELVLSHRQDLVLDREEELELEQEDQELEQEDDKLELDQEKVVELDLYHVQELDIELGQGDMEDLDQEAEFELIQEEELELNQEEELDFIQGETLELDQKEELLVYQEEELELDQEEELELDQEEELELDQEEELVLDQEKELELDQVEELDLDQEEELELDQVEELDLDQEEELQLDQEEELQLDQEEELQLDQEEELELDQEEELQLDQEEELELDQEEELELDQEKELELDQEEELDLDQEEELQLGQEEELQLGQEEELQLGQEQELQLDQEEEFELDQEEELELDQEEEQKPLLKLKQQYVSPIF